MEQITEKWHRRHKTIGDVHPIYDAQKRRWLLYYLATDGRFSSKLATSADMIVFEECPLTFFGTPRAPYYVVAPIKHKKFFYTWFGQQFTHVCSKSRDGVAWWPLPSHDIPVNQTVSGRGERDPYVAYDEASRRFYLVALSYPDASNDCAIVLRRTAGPSLAEWLPETNIIRKFHNGATWSEGEPECPQLVKLGRRWYLFASLARKTRHHVGGMSYWIGQIDKHPWEIPWDTLPRHELTSEDLCAAQIVIKNKQALVFGWIPQEAHGSLWGGRLNLPLLVKPDIRGRLISRFPTMIEKKPGLTTGLEQLNSGSSLKLTIAFPIVGERMTISFLNGIGADQHIVIDRREGRIFVASTALRVEHATLALSKRECAGIMNLMVFITDDLMEININQRETLHAKLTRPLSGDRLITSTAAVVTAEIMAD